MEDLEVLFDIINKHHEDNNAFQAKRKKILKKMVHRKGTKPTNLWVEDEIRRWEFKEFMLAVGEEYAIKENDDKSLGTITISPRFKTKIELIKNQPVFVIYRDNLAYLKQELFTKRAVGTKDIGEALETYRDSEAIIEGTKAIYELIEKKDYETVNSYITYSMEKLILPEILESTQRDKLTIYTQAQVLFRNIAKITSSLTTFNGNEEEYNSLLIQLDVLYRQICQILINAGLYEIPSRGR